MSGDGGNDRDSDDGESDDRDFDDCGSDDAERDRPASRVDSLSVDATLKLLADRERRRILGYLMDDPKGTATVSELADHLAEERAEEESETTDSGQLTTKLHHVHLPKLTDAGVVEYDDRSREVRYWGEDRLEAWHDYIRSYGDG